MGLRPQAGHWARVLHFSKHRGVRTHRRNWIILASFLDPPDLKKNKVFVWKVLHFSKIRFLRFFELPGAKKTSKKPFRLVNYEVLVGENVKSFGLAAFYDDNPRPNQDFWRSQSAFPRFLRVQMAGAS